MSGARGRALLADRLAAVPELLRARSRPAPELPPFDLGALRRVRITGAGASGGHARLLAARLAEAGVPALAAPPAAFAAPPGREAAEDALVVFSQGLSPNARAALARPQAWGATVLVTAAGGPGEDPERRAAVEALRTAGTWIVDVGAPPEYGTLVRLAGPVLALQATLELAHALGGPAPPTPRDAAEAFADAAARAREAAAALGPAELAPTWLCLAGARDPSWIDAQRLKLAEGLRRPFPPACDLLDFAHGPFQQIYPDPALLVAFAGGVGPQAGLEEELLERLARMLTPRHRLLRLPAPAGRDPALFAHDGAADALLLHALEACGVDPTDWAGRDQDGPLYRFTGPAAAEPEADRPAPAPASAATAPRERRLEALTWTEVEARLAEGARTAVVPLGSTEQHGPHLPLATDTWIADALAARFCAAVPEALRLPALALGCASEHLAFPGTLHVEEATLRDVLADVVRALDHHGFERVFVFSAHGGNVGALRRAAPRLAEAAARARVAVFTDHAGLAERLFAEAARHGVAPEAAGHHAGELEASIVAALRPGALRAGARRPGLAWRARSTEGLFDPDLRRRAPDGTVGDPRAAEPGRAEAYLAAWTALLVEAYREGAEGGEGAEGEAKRGAKKRHAT